MKRLAVVIKCPEAIERHIDEGYHDEYFKDPIFKIFVGTSPVFFDPSDYKDNGYRVKNVTY
jgi:hypothetical protein